MIKDRKEHERRLTLYMAGLNDREMGSRLGWHRATMKAWRDRFNLETNYKFKPFHARAKIIPRVALKMFKEGYTYQEIANKFDISMATIGQWFNDRNFTRRARSGARTERNQIIINEYHKTISDLNWREFRNHLYDKFKIDFSLEKIKLIVGKHLMRVCRSQESCAFKALLPENDPGDFKDEL